MTVRDWLRGRLPQPPEPLADEIFAALGADADAPEGRTGELCLDAAARRLDSLLGDGRLARESALELLAIDALMTYAYEHAGSSGVTGEELRTLSRRGAHMIGRLARQRG